MLNAQENELLTRTGPGTPMGNLLRQYWIPALLPSELPYPDCPPMRLRMLSENLIAFRTTSGQVGIIQNACPHRGASMFFGRNEEEGLRCVYHGWKFDVTGACVDMPSEPAESNFKNKVRTRAYPTRERNGVIWCYMGPRDVPPELPEHPGNLSPNARPQKYVRACNYMQALEGDIDTVHASFLHGGHVKLEDTVPGSVDYYATKQRSARLEVREHEVGYTYGAYRPAEEDTDCWRIGHFMLPFFTMNAPGVLNRRAGGNAYVPIDDEHVMGWRINVPQPQTQYGTPSVGGLFEAQRRNRMSWEGWNQPLPDTTDWIGKFRFQQNASNDYMIDREAQAKKETTYTGIFGGPDPEDRAVQESMGGIYDRTQEHLGTTDMMIIATRRKLLQACKALRDNGTIPPGVENPKLYWMFSGGAIVPRGVSGIEYASELLFGRSPDLAVAPQIGT
jgi:phenylpropionate dioxygenase-like ring-hydroxylating dioxygenase large terminal subunit